MKDVDYAAIDRMLWEREDLNITLNDLEDIHETETFLNELQLVEEGREFFDNYSFGYPGSKPLRFVEDNFRPLSVYDDHRYVRYMEYLELVKKRREERKRIKQERLEKEREKKWKKERRRELYKRRLKLREEAKKAAEKKAAFDKAMEEDRKYKDMLSQFAPEYNPDSPRPLVSAPTKKSRYFGELRRKYGVVHGEPGYEDTFLINELGCDNITAYDLTNLLKTVWPEREWE